MHDRFHIQTCREHHAIIKRLAERLSSPDLDAGARGDVLRNLQTVLLRHLQLEDNRLYPALSASSNVELAAKAQRYQQEMKPLHGTFVAFCERWTPAGRIAADSEGFAHDWNAVSAALAGRIAAEDHDLYDLAEKVLQ